MSIRVLVVDDSIIFRTKLQLSLNQDKDIEVVGSAINAKDAMGKIEELNPDVVTLDVEMPGMNGIEFLKTLIPKRQIPVVVVSSLPINALDALDAGAVDFVKKPDASQEAIKEFFSELTEKVKVASKAKVKRMRPVAEVAQKTQATSALASMVNVKAGSKSVIAIGASTGGFTDCMLQNGAKKVYSIDVGYGQLAWKLRSDERVVNLERTNFRYVTHEQIPEEIDFASVDVSFISLKIILPVMYELLKENGEAVCLIKPQFEAGREKVGKKGVVRDVNVHIEVIENIVDFAASQKFKVLGLSFSPVKGPEGNIEYLIYLKKTNEITSCEEYIEYAKELAKMSHDELDKKGE